MARFLFSSRFTFPAFLAFTLGTLLFLGEARANTQDTAPARVTYTVSATSTPAPVCFAWTDWINWRAVLGNRRRMIQVTLVAVCIGIAFLLKGRIK